MKSFIPHCFNHLNQSRLVAKVDKANIASKKITESLGFHFNYVLKKLPEEFSHSNGELYYSLTQNDLEEVADA
jgi:RimJ/RimL family protein N-acetyltransferase